MVTLEMIRELALALPETVEVGSPESPAFQVRRKSFVWLKPDGETLVVRLPEELRDALIQTEPDVYYITPHYQPNGYMLVRRSAVEREALADLLTDSWLLAAPARLHAQLDAEPGPT